MALEVEIRLEEEEGTGGKEKMPLWDAKREMSSLQRGREGYNGKAE